MGLNVEDAVRCHAVDLTGLERIILREYAHMAGETTGLAWPSVNRLARITQSEDRSAKRAIASLVKRGYLVNEGRATGYPKNYAPVVYRVVVQCNSRCHEGKNGWITHYPEGKAGATYRPLYPGGIDDPDSDDFIPLEPLSGVTQESPLENLRGDLEVTPEDAGVTQPSPLHDYRGDPAVTPGPPGVTERSPLEESRGDSAVTSENAGVTQRSPLDALRGDSQVIPEGPGVTSQAIRGDRGVTQTTKEPPTTVDIPRSEKPDRAKTRDQTPGDLNGSFPSMESSAGRGAVDLLPSTDHEVVEAPTDPRERIRALGPEGYLRQAEAKANAGTKFPAIVKATVGTMTTDGWNALIATECPMDSGLPGRFAKASTPWTKNLDGAEPKDRERALEIVAAAMNAVWATGQAMRAEVEENGQRPPRGRVAALAQEAFKHLLDGYSTADVRQASVTAALNGHFRMDQILVNINRGGHTAASTPAWQELANRTNGASPSHAPTASSGGPITGALGARERRRALEAQQVSAGVETIWEEGGQ